jgi:hypothetical protein
MRMWSSVILYDNGIQPHIKATAVKRVMRVDDDLV